MDSAPFQQREDGELVLLELEEAPVTSSAGGTAAGAWGAAAREAPGFVASRLLHDKDTVASVVTSGAGTVPGEPEVGDEEDEPAVIAAYWLSADQASRTPNLAFLMQKKQGRRLSGAPGGHGQLEELEEGEGEDEDGRIVGKPMLLAYDSSWSCARLRFSIWEQVLRFVSASASAAGGRDDVDMLSSDDEEDGGEEGQGVMEVEEERKEWMQRLLEGDLKVTGRGKRVICC